MIDKSIALDTIFSNVLPVMESCGFSAKLPDGRKKGESGVYERGESLVMDFSGEKGILRLVYSSDRLHLLSGAPDVDLSDDSSFNLDSTFLLIPEEYDEKDIKSLSNEINEYLSDTYAKKAKIVSKTKNVQTVSKAAADRRSPTMKSSASRRSTPPRKSISGVPRRPCLR